MHALIVEPSLSFQNLLSSALRAQGFDPIESKQGREAITLAESKTIELIVISAQLADMSAKDLIDQLHSMPPLRHVPIFVLTSSTDREKSSEYIEAGATELFQRRSILSFERSVAMVARNISSSRTRGGNILYVEEDKRAALSTSQVLSESGFNVNHIRSMDAAIVAFEKNDFHLVLTDVILDGELSGLSLVRHIREHKESKKNRVPIIAMSAHGNDARRVQLFKAGISDYVTKPVLFEELLARVANQVRNEQLLQQLDLQQAQLINLAMRDQLTGLYNRHFLMETVEKRIVEAKRNNLDLSIIVIDVDHFKQVNDVHGHAIGDQVLVEVGELLQDAARKDDTVTRYGGEEFVLLMNHCKLEHAVEKAEKLRLGLESLKPAGLSVTASFGVASLDKSITEFTDLFCRADEAVYRAKDRGRNCVISA